MQTFTIVNAAGGLRGFGPVRFPPGTSTFTEAQLRPIAEHPHLRAALEAGWLTITPDDPAAGGLPLDVSHGTHDPAELTEEEQLAILEAEENERLAAEAAALAAGTGTPPAQ
jgi:hypothetical protein